MISDVTRWEAVERSEGIAVEVVCVFGACWGDADSLWDEEL